VDRDQDIRDAIDRMREADDTRRAAERSTPVFHAAAAEVQDEARRVFELTQESEQFAIRDEDDGESPDPLDDI
jgi:hypothetical protein